MFFFQGRLDDVFKEEWVRAELWSKLTTILLIPNSKCAVQNI